MSPTPEAPKGAMTTPEAVAALRERLQREWPVYGVKTDNAMLEAAAMLEALSAERDEARATADAITRSWGDSAVSWEKRCTAAEAALEAGRRERDELRNALGEAVMTIAGMYDAADEDDPAPTALARWARLVASK